MTVFPVCRFSLVRAGSEVRDWGQVLAQGGIKKVVKMVDQITFSGPQSLVRRQTVLYLTERASFRLTTQGLKLFELAPGIDLQRDVLDQMAFAPILAKNIAVMPQTHFMAGDAC